jgi:CheY-like chemotaxis protein
MKRLIKTSIVDDDRIYIFGLTKLIEMNSFCEELQVFKNGKEAIDSFINDIEEGKQLPEVILLDINMPVMDGWEFLEEYAKVKHKIKNKVKIYMVSSSVNLSDLDKAKSYEDVVDYVIKPIKSADLQKISNDYFESV